MGAEIAIYPGNKTGAEASRSLKRTTLFVKLLPKLLTLWRRCTETLLRSLPMEVATLRRGWPIDLKKVRLDNQADQIRPNIA